MLQPSNEEEKNVQKPMSQLTFKATFFKNFAIKETYTLGICKICVNKVISVVF